jgi:hypothetical protein|tara:strand:+ start:4892 stop:6061 length:1170 start_codon:yes stop_codon:yes gene_type:complete
MENETQTESFQKVEIFDNPQDLASSMQRDAAAPADNSPADNAPADNPAPVQSTVQEEVQPLSQEPTEVFNGEVESTPYVDPDAGSVQEQVVMQPEPEQNAYSQQDVEGAVLNFMSERLGRQVTSFDDFNAPSPPALDERLEVISKFVADTGRSPEDWFAYQQLNTSEMDDYTAVRVQMASDHNNLSPDELNLLVSSRYKLDPEANTEAEVQLSQLQLKIDGAKAKQGIEEIRNSYVSTKSSQESNEQESFINQDWINDMSVNVDALTGLEFNLGGEKTFTFGIDDKYKSQLKEKNAKLDSYFDSYVREDGSWDYDQLSSHQAVVDNIDTIVSSAYRQGMSDGQRGVVSNAANVQTAAPNDASGQKQSTPLTDQVRQILQRNKSKVTFNI